LANERIANGRFFFASVNLTLACISLVKIPRVPLTVDVILLYMLSATTALIARTISLVFPQSVTLGFYYARMPSHASVIHLILTLNPPHGRQGKKQRERERKREREREKDSVKWAWTMKFSHVSFPGQFVTISNPILLRIHLGSSLLGGV
jgi:hypothetical protein